MAYYTDIELKEIGFKYIGTNVRLSKTTSIYNPEKMIIGNNCKIDDFCILSGKIELGNNIHISVYCHVAGGDEGIYMEDFSGLSHYVNIFTRSDDYSGRFLTNPTVPDEYKNIKKGSVTIKKHGIIGCNSVIFPGVIIEEGVAVGAMSLVNKPTIPWKTYIGIPAKSVGDRSKALLELEKKYIQSNNHIRS